MSIAGISLFIYFMYYSMHNNIDSDHLWSITIGKWIAEFGRVPTEDPFSWSVDTKWITHQWLFCVLIYNVDALWSDFGIRIMFLISTILSLIVILSILNNNKNLIYNVFCFFLFLGIYLMYFYLRAYVFSLPIVILLLYLVYFRRKTYWIFTVPLLLLIWVNLHSMAVLFACFLLFDSLLDYVYTKNMKMLYVTVFSFIVTLLNPYGFNIWVYVIRNFLEPGHKRYISEWQPMDFSSLAILLFYTLVAFLIILVLTKNSIRGDNISLSLTIVTVGSYIYSIHSSRALLYFSILFILFLVHFQKRNQETHIRSWMIVPLIVMILQSIILIVFVFDEPAKIHTEENWPQYAVEFLKENESYQENLFNEYVDGGYLMYHGIPTFIDARADLFMEAGIFDDYVDLRRLKKDPDHIMKTYEIKNFLVSKDTPLYFYLNKCDDYKIVYNDDKYAIFSVYSHAN